MYDKYEVRAYRHMVGRGKVRIAKIEKSDGWFGFFAWMRLWFTLRKKRREREESYRGIAADCSPVNVHH